MKKTFLFLTALFVIPNQSINCMDGKENSDDAEWIVLAQPLTAGQTNQPPQAIIRHEDFPLPVPPKTTAVLRRRRSQSGSSTEELRAQRNAEEQEGSPSPEDDWNEFIDELRNLPALLGQVMSAAFSSCVPGSQQRL